MRGRGTGRGEQAVEGREALESDREQRGARA